MAAQIVAEAVVDVEIQTLEEVKSSPLTERGRKNGLSGKNMVNSNVQGQDIVLALLDQQIALHIKQLKRLLDAKKAYSSEDGDKDDNTYQEAISFIMKQNRKGITVSLVDEIVEEIAYDTEFCTKFVYKELQARSDLSDVKLKNGVAQLCSILSRKVKQGTLLKTGRGSYVRPKQEIKTDDQSCSEG